MQIISDDSVGSLIKDRLTVYQLPTQETFFAFEGSASTRHLHDSTLPRTSLFLYLES